MGWFESVKFFSMFISISSYDRYDVFSVVSARMNSLPSAIASDDKGPRIIATTCSSIATTTLFVIARIFTKAHLNGKLQFDDYIIIISTVSRHITTTALHEMLTTVRYLVGWWQDSLWPRLPRGAVGT
jgi:hypothetical protein